MREMSQVGVESPVISFRLEGTLLPRQIAQLAPQTSYAVGTQALEGAVEALQAVREVGARSVVISSLPTALAAQALQAANLTANAVHGDIGSLNAGRAFMEQTRPIAHVGSRSTDVGMSIAAQTRSILVSPNSTRRQEWRAMGADHTLADLAAFPDLLDFSGQYVSAREGRSLLQIGRTTWQDRLHMGWLPVETDILGHTGIRRAFLQALLEYTRGQRPDRQELRLGRLAWLAAHGTATPREAAEADLKRLRDEGALHTTQDVAAAVGYSVDTVRKWASEGVIPVMQARRNFYFLPRHTEHLRQRMGSLVVEEAAAILNIHRASVTRLVRQGQLAADAAPNGLRFDPAAVYLRQEKSLQERRDDIWTTQRTADAFGTSVDAVKRWRKAGILHAEMIRGWFSYDPEQILALKAEMETLHPDFDWLPASLLQKLRDRALVQAQFQCGGATISRWTKAGLLPACNRAPAALQTSDFWYVGKYLDVLAASSHARPVTKKIVTRFKERCVEAQAIVPGPLR